MGMMKQYLMDKTRYLAIQLGMDEAKFYSDTNLNNMSYSYAQYLFHKEQEEKNTREEIKKAILARTDEVVDLIQGLLKGCNSDKSNCCGVCFVSFLCENSTQYK